MDETADSVRKSNAKLPNKTLLQKFSVLGEGNDDERIKATKVILDQLTARQTDSEKARKLVILLNSSIISSIRRIQWLRLFNLGHDISFI